MSSSSYLELLKLKRAKLLKVIDLYECAMVERSDFVNESLCGRDNVSCNHFTDAVLKLYFNSDVRLECLNKKLSKLRSLICMTPDSSYKSRPPSHIGRHELVHHRGVKPLKCRDCEYASNWKSTLLEHQVKAHSKNTGCKNVFVCEFDGCNYRTTFSTRAIEHRRGHLKIKPFKCHYPNCGHSFASHEHLRRHKKIHVKKKPFRCMQSNCNFATKRRDYLKLHQATHNSVRAFKCPHNNCTYAAKQRKSPEALTHSF